MAKRKLTKEQKRYLAYVKRRAKKIAGILERRYGEDVQTAVGDCIADLMHLCTLKGWDYWAQHENGLMHHNAELRDARHG